MGGDRMTRRLTALIEGEAGGFLALCPELDIASQGETVEAAGTTSRRLSNCSSRPRPPRRPTVVSPARSP